jgi:hypothetical protein
VKLSESGTDIAEGAFSYCSDLTSVQNLQYSENIDSYAFAHTGIVEADLSGAVTLGDFVFLKDKFTPFKVTLGNALTSLGDNPFAMCLVEPFSVDQVITFNGVDYVSKVYTYDISDTVKVFDGSLYCKIKTGYELIVYGGVDHTDVKVADDTVRISAYAFAGSDVQMIKLPYTVGSIGHKAFYGCDKLTAVAFSSYDAPILEEEFDAAYYESFEHIPGIGNYGEFNDYAGNPVSIEGAGIVPYYMWNATGEQYSNVFYGANFVDYVGYVNNKLTMVKPVNGQHYDTYIMDHYFDLRIDGAAGADDTTLAAIAAINAIPERVTYDHKSIVEAARAAYNKIAIKEQQALVTNYDVLVTAEQRITALTPVEPEVEVPEPVKANTAWLAWVVIGLGIAGVAVAVFFDRKREKVAKTPKREEIPVQAEITEEPAEVAETQETAETEE